MQISPSILTCDYAKMGEELKFVERSGVDMVHLDVMDGVFVPNLSFGPPVIKRLRPVTDLPFDVHNAHTGFGRAGEIVIGMLADVHAIGGGNAQPCGGAAEDFGIGLANALVARNDRDVEQRSQPGNV